MTLTVDLTPNAVPSIIHGQVEECRVYIKDVAHSELWLLNIYSDWRWEDGLETEIECKKEGGWEMQEHKVRE